MTSPQIGLLRLVSQRLTCSDRTTPDAAVRWMGAMQGQDYRGALTSIALRTAGRTRGAVVAALNAGEIVRSWPMRGTIHVVAAEDLPWMLRWLTPRVVAGAARRRAQLDLDEKVLEQARMVAIEALRGGRQLRRDDLMSAWNAAGISTESQRGYHMLWHLAQTGTMCFGPVQDAEQRIVLIDEWIAGPPQLARDEALGELATRYFRSHGPATAGDLSRWAHLTMADVRTGLAAAEPHLAHIEVDGTTYHLDPQAFAQLDAFRAEAEGVLLLPGFDEFILGYGDRRAVITDEFADQLVPGRNGVFKPTVVSGGRVIGTWRHSGRRPDRTFAASPFTAFTDDVSAVLPEIYARLP